MKDAKVERAGEPIQWQTSRSRRILVVDDEPMVRRLNTKILIAAGYQVDAAADGSLAWDTLQTKSFDLLITDNSMPKVTGVELIEKVRAAGMAVPVIMATSALPHEELTRRPWLQPAATLIKPYTLAEFLRTVKNVLCAAVPIVVLQLCLPLAINAQELKQDRNGAVQPNAVTLSVRGNCDCSEDGVTFTKFERGHIFEQGAIVRTGDEARADLFLRRTGTTIRLQPGTEIRLEKMTVTLKDDLPAVHTLLNLRAGRIFTVVRSTVAGSTLEIRNAAGRSVVEGSGVGRYIITADGTRVSATGSAIPLKVIGENGITIIAAGQQFARKDGKMLPVSTTSYVKDLIQLDELQAITEVMTQ
jgi:DNA-binding response OmpR family regulator